MFRWIPAAIGRSLLILAPGVPCTARILTTEGAYIEESKREPGVYDQPQVGVKFATTLLQAHKLELQQIPLKTKFVMDGFNQSPKTTLAELLQFATATPERSCDAIYHFRRELNLVTE